MNNPHLNDAAAEKSMLRRAMSEPGKTLCRPLVEQMFHSGMHLKCWRHISDIWVSGATPALENMQDPEIREFMEGVLASPEDCMSTEVAAKRMHAAWFRRRSMRQAEKIHEMAQEGRTVDEIQSQLDQVSSATFGGDGPTMMSDLNAVVDFLEWRAANPGVIRGLSFGMSQLESMMDGLPENSTTIIGARPSVGKTAFMGTMALNLALEGTPVYYMSLEMTQFNMKLRAVQQLCGFSAGAHRDQGLTADEGRRLMDAFRRLKELRHFIIDDSREGRNLRMFPTLARRAVQQFGAKVLMVDYLQLLDDPRERDMRLKVKAASGALHAASRELGVSVVAAAQLNRPGNAAVYRKSQEEYEAPPPSLESLKESGAIEEDADQVILLHRDQANNGCHVDAILAKNRNGPVGKVSMVFDPEATRFKEEVKW